MSTGEPFDLPVQTHGTRRLRRCARRGRHRGGRAPAEPLSSLGHLTPAPPPGPLGPEGVPVPRAPVFANPASVKLGQTVDGVTCERTEKIAFHIHAHLTIFVSGRAFQIPYGIGIGPPVEGVNTTAGPFATSGSCFMWLHTHALDGIIHIEAPKLQTFTLGQFFAVWGVKLSKLRLGSQSARSPRSTTARSGREARARSRSRARPRSSSTSAGP